jgi:pimeloyl-ACP methyl ester carboxylesterase
MQDNSALGSTEPVDGSTFELAFNDHGHDEPTLIFIHGFGEGGYVWVEVIDQVARYRCVTIDLRGHGDSPWDPQCGYTLDHHVRDTARLICTEVTGTLVLIGHSMGASIALRLCQEFSNVQGLVLVDLAQTQDLRVTEQIGIDFREASRRFGSADEFASWLRDRRPLVSRARAQMVAREALREAPDGGFELKRDPAMLAVRSRAPKFEPGPLLAKSTVPVLVVRGGMSAMLSAQSAQDLARAAPQGRLCTVPMAGHGVMLENPSALGAALQDFIGNGIRTPAT